KIEGADATDTLDARIQAVLGTAKVTVGSSSDKTGYSLAIDQSAVTIGTATSIQQIEGTDATNQLDARIQAVMGTAKVTVGASNDKTGYSLAADQQVDVTKIEGSDATNQLDARIQAVMGTAKITVGASNDKTGYSLAADQQVNTTKIEGSDATDTIDARIQAVLGTAKLTLGATGLDAVTVSEPAATFGWPTTIGSAVAWMGALSRNKMKQTTGTTTLRTKADGADLATSVVSFDGTTLLREEWS
ncbi:hypothetical protein LCGC14_1476710, partial [marine sediment metagenome]